MSFLRALFALRPAFFAWLLAAAGPLLAGTPEITNSGPSFSTRYPAYYAQYSCDSCHLTVPALNSYGTSYKTAVSALTGGRTVQANVGTALANIEATDSDGDGYRNVIEINALKKTWDSADHPNAGATLGASPTAKTGSPGTTVAYSVVLTNTGNITDSFTLGVQVTSGQAWTTAVSGTANNIPAGGTATFTVNVTIPSTATPGQSSVASVTAVSQANAGVGASPLTLTTDAKLAATVSLTSSKNPTLTGEAVTFTATVGAAGATPTGTVTFKDLGATLCSAVALSSGVAQCSTSTLAGGTHSISAEYSGSATYAPVTSTPLSQTVTSPSAPGISINPTSIDFGGQSMGTTSPGRAVTITNSGTATLTISNIALSNAQFAQTNNCTSVAPSATCTITVTFSPAVAAGALNSTVAVSANLTFASNATGSPHTVTLAGTAEKLLVTHYYRSILRRDPDSGGKTFWQGEATRVQGLGVNVNETWYAMAMQFYASAEYAAFNRDNTAFVTDLYNTFFNRPPDSGGLAYWLNQISSGVPRDGVLVHFMLSPEFVNFTQAIFGNTAARAEVDMVMDFYRGFFGRLPDSAGFNFYLGRFRTAQCQGAAAVSAEVESISSFFANSAEYAGRGRATRLYVTDLFNAFVRRGPDLDGLNFWVGQIDTGARTRDNVRQSFRDSPEFGTRVQRVVSETCIPQ